MQYLNANLSNYSSQTLPSRIFLLAYQLTGFKMMGHFFVIVLACYAVVASGEMIDGENIVSPPDAPCRHVVARLVKRQLGELSICINETEYKTKKERAAKIACLIKCVGIREKIITKEGKLDQAHADAYMKREIPAKLLPYAQPVLQKCFDLGMEVVDPTEEYCHSYKPTLKCVMDEVTKICDELDPIAS